MSLSARQIKFIRSLQQKKVRDQHGICTLEGERAVVSAIKAGARVDQLIASDSGLAAKVKSKVGFRGQIESVSARQMSALTDVRSPPGILAVLRMAWLPVSELSALKRIVVLDAVQDPGNVGTIIRTAAWFGVGGVICGPGTADPYGAKVIRSTAGTLWSVSLCKSTDLVGDLKYLQDSGISLVAATMSGSDYRAHTFREQCLLVVGNEANGIRSEVTALIPDKITIPGDHGDDAESLNVAVSAGILMSAW